MVFFDELLAKIIETNAKDAIVNSTSEIYADIWNILG